MSAFEKIAGYKKEKEELAALAEIFIHRKKYELKGATLPRGIIFYGPAGTGKTLFAEVLAEECKLKKINVSISDTASEVVICRRIRRAFMRGTKSKSPTMIFFDELDKVLPNSREEYYTDRAKTILSQLLTLIDGMERIGNVVFVAACNDYAALPESITRPGRFDKKLCLDLPDLPSRIAILELYMGASAARFEMGAESIAKLCGGFSPAALKTLVNECILVSDEANFVSEAKIRAKITEIKEEDIPAERSEKSYFVDAVKRVGSFLIARAYSSSDYVLSVDGEGVSNNFLDAIIRESDPDDDEDYYDDDADEERDGDAGKYEATPEGTQCSRNDCIAAITALLGGFVAEEIMFGKIYDNLGDALSSVWSILFRMSENGMLGFKHFYKKYEEYDYTEKFREALEAEFQRIMGECYESAKAQLEKNEPLLKRLVPTLIKRKSIEKAECEQIIAEIAATPAE